MNNPQPQETVKSARWQYKQHSWAVYQLPDGVCVMSDYQMSKQVGRVKADARSFVKLHNLPTTRVQIPNGKVIAVNPLTTVAAYWQFLLETDQLPCDVLTKSEWSRLIKALRYAYPETLNTSGWKLQPNSEDPSNQPPVVAAETVSLRLLEKTWLKVLILPRNEYRISFTSGLLVIGLSPEWLLELPKSPRKLKKLEKKGFSGASKQCIIDTPSGIETVESLSLEDWLVVWEFLAARGNSKAAAVLKACASENLPQRIETAIENTH